MRVTVTIPDEIGTEVERLAAEEGRSVSALYAEAVAMHVRERRRERAFAEVERLLTQSQVAPGAAEMLETLRREDEHRVG